MSLQLYRQQCEVMPHVDMQKYCWPGFDMHLIRELQKQQNSSQFCDTLLHTDGISVPTHSCILAALSPHLSQRLETSASPPSGQKRQLQLQPVKAQILLKLVGLLYSGEMEVNESIELNDVLAVARQLGISNLVKRQKDGENKEWEIQENMQGNSIYPQGSEREGKRKMQDVQVQVEMAAKRDTVLQPKNITFVSSATQTATTGEKSVGSCISWLSKAPTPQCVPFQNVEFSVMLEPQNNIHDQFCFPSCPGIPNKPSGAKNNTHSSLDQSACSVISPKSASSLSYKTMAIRSDERNVFMAQEDSTYQQFSECGNNIPALAKERTGLQVGERSRCSADNRATTEQTRQASRDEVRGDERGKFTEKSNAHGIVGKKNLARIKHMGQMIETTQISFKVKLRRRSNGEVWEVVSPQDTVKTSNLAFQQQGSSNHKGPHANAEPPPHTVEFFGVHQPETMILKPTSTNSLRPPPQHNSPPDCEPPSSDSFTQNQRHSQEAAPLPQSPGPAEESDEQIEKLLEDIMMGFNILPNLERDCKKSHHILPSCDEVPTIIQVPVAQTSDTGHREIPAAVSEAGSVFYQDLGTQSVFSVNTGDSERMSFQTMLPSKSQECLHPKTPPRKPVMPSAFFCSGQKHHYQEFQEQSSQDILSFLPLVTGNETLSLPPVFLPCVDDFRLPQCLSPLESATKHQAIINPVKLGDKVQEQPCLHGRPWLAENPGSLNFPLSASNHRQNKCACLSQDTNYSCWSKQQDQDLNPQSGGTWAGPFTVQAVEEKEILSGSLQNVAELKSHEDPMKIKKASKCQQGDITGDAITFMKRKRKLPSHPQNPSSLLAGKCVKVSAGMKRQINLSSCSVSLFSNNVLVKKRAVATCSSNAPSVFVGKLNPLSSITENPRTKEPGVITEQTRIMTRGFVKRTQESTCSTSRENSVVPKSVSCRSKIVNNNRDTLSKRKRGRPPKASVDVLSSVKSSPAVIEEKRHSGECHPKIKKDLSKEDLEKGDKTREHKKTKGNGSSNLGVIPLDLGNESTSNPDAINNDIIPTVRNPRTPKRLLMVSLKEFKNLIKMQHSKTRKSKESQERYENVKEGMATRDSTAKETSKDTKMDEDAKFHGRGKSGESVTFSVTVEKDHDQIFDEKEDVSRLDAKRNPLKNPDEGKKSCDAKGSLTTQETSIDIEGLSHGDSPLEQENKLVSDHNLYPQAPETAGPSLLDDSGISRTLSCDQEEEEEDVEVDVMIFSPDKVPETKDCEHGLNKMEITPDEDEEEDVRDIDVTGDEEE
ncbi:hypothetical protein Q5P01_026122 [Channa striata]|uniref:BTB domain-containing protein n=1 Tax=Channa striata TaxID=64152 RepID=A0AA88LGV3_CHASR|nr:hypothetical protein Q5P01_026122 [Channa striata]